MTITVPADVLASVGIESEEALRLEFAILLCSQLRLTTAKAAAFAGMNRFAFEQLLVEHQIPFYDEEELAHDLSFVSPTLPFFHSPTQNTNGAPHDHEPHRVG